MARKKQPELTFQQHVTDFLVREHKYGVLEQSDITDTEYFIAEDQLWAFLTATQADMLTKLTDAYSTDARDEVFKALHKELEYTPLWMLLRHGLKVRGLEFRLFYPKPRSAESAAVVKHCENRITFRPHLYFGETNQEIDFVFFLNGLPIVALELKHEKNQTVHDAVAQFAARDHACKIFRHPFLYLAADTCDAMAATDPRREQNFRWHNTGLTNESITKDGSEYPVEFHEEMLYPKGVVSKALQNVAFQDDGLIQYKAEVMLRIFEKDVMPLIGGRAKAMIVTTSRVAGLRYFQIIKEKLKTRGTAYKALFAFSDFVHPETNAAISEHAVNELKDGELIEQRFEGDDYRLMIVASKFQTGFDQPLLAGMFLDATFAEYVGPQLIKAGSVSELMKQIRRTEVIKAAVEYQGVESGDGTVRLKPGTGKKGSGPPQKKVSVQDMIVEIQTRFAITDDEALYIRQVTQEKAADIDIHSTVIANRDKRDYLEGAYRWQVNGKSHHAS